MKEKNLIKTLKLMSIVLVLLVFLLTIVLIDNSSKKYVDSNTKSVYTKVLSTYDDFILVKDLDNDEKYTISTDKKYGVGDILYITYLKDIEKPKKIEVVMSKEEETKLDVVDDIKVEEETTTTIPNTTKEAVRENTTKVVNATTTTKQVINNSNVDDIIINYVESAKTVVESYTTNEDNKAKAKEYFCNIVDFIFYGGSINGHTFNELSTKAKAKVIYYALIIDSKIDNKWPGYKDTISEKYNTAKGKLIAKYLDICSDLKEKDPQTYEELKSDFALLKKSLSLTWDVVKTAFSYASDFTVSHLKSWYETFRG